MMRKTCSQWLALVAASACLLCLCLSCSKDGKKSSYASTAEFESEITSAFHPYGIVGAQVRADSSLVFLYTTGDFLETYDQNKEQIQQLLRTWLDQLSDFRNKQGSVGIVVRNGQVDLMHASRDPKGRVVFNRT